MSEIKLEIDAENLDKELMQHAASFAYVGEQAVSAEAAYAEFKVKVEELYAVLDRDVRAAAEAEGRKMTEPKIAAEILVNENYKKAQGHLIRLKANMDVLKVRREAWKERGSMLVQLCAMKRSEMEAISYGSMKSAA
jgi:hypothetical protein